MFQSSWGSTPNNTNQQQQQPQPTNAFGQPGGFGSAGMLQFHRPKEITYHLYSGFGGGTGAFAQPQQPQANPIFGNIGTQATPATTSGFGRCF